MRGLQIIQVGQATVNASAAGVDHLMTKAAHRVNFRRHSYISKLSSQKIELESGKGEDGIGEGLDREQMVSVQFRGNEITVPRGTLLRTALLQHGLTPHSEGAVIINCRGLATCGTCAVQIEGPVLPATRGVRESFRLNMPPHAPPQNANLRLACQVQLDGDVKVTKYNKFWGQGRIPLGSTSASDSVTPLGDLEFLLDFEKKSKNV